MALPPISRNPVVGSSKKTDASHKVGGEEPKNPKVRDLASRMNVPEERPDHITAHVTRESSSKEQGRSIGYTGIHLPHPEKNHDLPPSPKTPNSNQGQLVYNNHLQGLGLFGSVPQEMLDQVINKMPALTPENINECINQMKIFWKAPSDAKSENVVFGSIDAQKFARWIGENKLPIKDLPLSPEDFKNLLPHLEYLDLSGKDIPFDQLAKCKNLKHLNLDLVRGCPRDEDLAKIALPGLTSLNFNRCSRFSDANFESLAKILPGITSLDARDCNRLTGTGLEEIAKLRRLTSLDVAGCDQLTDVDFEQLGKLTGLTSLNVQGCFQLTDVGFEQIAKLTGLTFLSVENCYVLTEASLVQIAKLIELTSLNVSRCQHLTDTGLEQIATLPGLTSLDVFGCIKLTNAGLEQLRTKLPNLDLKV